jgi:hypothetical protein
MSKKDLKMIDGLFIAPNGANTAEQTKPQGTVSATSTVAPESVNAPSPALAGSGDRATTKCTYKIYSDLLDAFKNLCYDRRITQADMVNLLIEQAIKDSERG